MQFSSNALRPFYDNLLTQLRAWEHYLKTLLFPIDLSISYDFPISHSILEPQVLLSIFILVTAVVAVWKISKHHRAIGFFALWFAVNLLPTNSLIPLEDVVTDRWLYLSSVGFAIILALFVKWIFLARVRTGSRARKLIFFFLCALILELYGAATLLRNITWSNDWMLWEDAVSKSPNKDRPHHELGLALMDAGQTEEAAREFKKVLEINPQHSVAYLNLGNTYLRQGKLAEAAENYQRALSMDYRPIAADIHNNLGAIYSRQGRLPEAIQEFQKSIAARPLNEVAYFNLGDIYERMGDMDRAISCMEKAVKITPEFFQGHKALHRLYEKRGWKEKSQEAYRKYLTYSPAAKFLPPARQNLK